MFVLVAVLLKAKQELPHRKITNMENCEHKRVLELDGMRVCADCRVILPPQNNKVD